MALQGDLNSFALADVLRLLAGTTKTGRLDVAGDAGNGEVWLDRGDLVGGEVTTSPHASCSADVVFEMLRFENGTFRFDEGEVPPDTVERCDVDDAISAAEGLLVRWVEIEAVVPSVHTWLTLAETVDADTVTVSGDQWRLLAAIAAGSTPRLLGDRFELTDLEACALTKELVEFDLVEVGESIEPLESSRTVVAEAPSESAVEGSDDVFHLSAEDGPVVLETRDDALLPEPLPGEGTSFVGELDSLGTVDGHAYGTVEPEVFQPFDPDELRRTGFDAEEDDPVFTSGDEAAPSWSSYGSLDSMVDDEGAPVDEPVDEPAAESVTDDGDATDEDGELPLAETLAEFGGATDDFTDDDRGSLLKFLSSVKP